MARATAWASASCFFFALVAVPGTSQAQNDVTTCSGNYNYCVETARRTGASTAPCDAIYQQCMRTGTIPDPYNRRSQPMERR